MGERLSELSRVPVQVMDGTLARLKAFVADLNTTNGRIVTTLAMVVLTTLRYLGSATWVPSVEWLAFLAAMSGLDSLTFYGKRKTHIPPKETE